jgi:hypothetical protein
MIRQAYKEKTSLMSFRLFHYSLYSIHSFSESLWITFEYVAKYKKTAWSLARKRTIPTGGRHLLAKLVPTCAVEVCHVVRAVVPTAVNLGFLDRNSR